jgi:hypothetical protein
MPLIEVSGLLDWAFSPKYGTIAAVSNIACVPKRKMQGNSKMGMVYHFQTSYICLLENTTK